MGWGAKNVMGDLEAAAVEAVARLRPALSELHSQVWEDAEPAWREYQSSQRYVRLLREEGFDVEEGSGGMPTAFAATWGSAGPTVGMYAEYDATPGYSQQAIPQRSPRPHLHWAAPGFTDSHAALGVGALAGAIAAKRVAEANGIPLRLRFFGEPAEKVCGSKAVHAAHGYYDDLDAAVSYHPFWFNTALTETLGTHYWSVVFTFTCDDEDEWLPDIAMSKEMGTHNRVRSPGAVDAAAMMLSNAKALKEHMFPRTGLWSLNESILGANNPTADNLPGRISQIQYSWRSPLLGVQEAIESVLRRAAENVARMTNTHVAMRWITRVRPGLPNVALTETVFGHLRRLGAPQFDESVHEHARRLESALGLEVSEAPFMHENLVVTSLERTEANMRKNLPEWQTHSGADDYTEYSWHCPTARFFTARPFLHQLGSQFWHWANNSFNGLPAAMDPAWARAGEVSACSVLEYATDADLRARAAAEYERRVDGAAEDLRAPLLDRGFAAPHDLPWPEYVTTARGREWSLPTTTNFGEILV